MSGLCTLLDKLYNICEWIHFWDINFKASPSAATSVTHEQMHPTVSHS